MAPYRQPLSYAEEPPDLIAGRLCLDFVNTRENRKAPLPEQSERLVSFKEFIIWATAAKAISPGHASRLVALGAKRPEKAARALQEAQLVRETIFALALSRPSEASAELSYLNECLRDFPNPTLGSNPDDSLEWDFGSRADDLRTGLWTIIWDAADLIASEERHLIRTCSDNRCGWLFLDHSRGGNRRWCSMRDCGNRDKVRRHTRRKKLATQGTA